MFNLSAILKRDAQVAGMTTRQRYNYAYRVERATVRGDCSYHAGQAARVKVKAQVGDDLWHKTAHSLTARIQTPVAPAVSWVMQRVAEAWGRAGVLHGRGFYRAGIRRTYHHDPISGARNVWPR